MSEEGNPTISEAPEPTAAAKHATSSAAATAEGGGKTENPTKTEATSLSSAAAAGGLKTDNPNLSNILEDARYKQGIALQKEGKYEEALACLGACMAIV